MTNEEKANLISERYQTHTADFRNGVYNGALVVLNLGINWKHPGKGELPEYDTNVIAILTWNHP